MGYGSRIEGKDKAKVVEIGRRFLVRPDKVFRGQMASELDISLVYLCNLQ